MAPTEEVSFTVLDDGATLPHPSSYVLVLTRRVFQRWQFIHKKKKNWRVLMLTENIKSVSFTCSDRAEWGVGEETAEVKGFFFIIEGREIQSSAPAAFLLYRLVHISSQRHFYVNPSPFLVYIEISFVKRKRDLFKRICQFSHHTLEPRLSANASC